MPPTADQAFTVLLDQLRQDARRAWRLSSCARFARARASVSTLTTILIVRDSTPPLCSAGVLPLSLRTGIDCIIHGFTGFHQYAAYGSLDAWDRYDTAHVGCF